MKSTKIISTLFFMLLGSILAGVLGVNPAIGAAAMQIMHFIPMPAGILGINALTSKVLKEQSATAHERMLEIHNKAKTENRLLNSDEKKEYNELKEKRDKLTPQIEELEERENLEGLEALKKIDSYIEQREKKPYLEEWRNISTGEKVPVFGVEHRFADMLKPEERDLHPGKALRGIITGNWDNAEAERRALTTGTSGITLPQPLMAKIIDKARELSIVSQAGVKYVGMTTKTLSIARIATDPTVAFKTEAQSFTDDTAAALDAITLTAYTMGGIINVTKELIQDSPNIDEALFMAIAGAVAKKIDYSLMFGAGTSEPTGWDTMTNIQEIAAVAAISDYSDFISAWSKVLTEAGQPNGFILHPREAATLEGLIATGSGIYLPAPKCIADLKRLITNQIPTDYDGDSSNKSVAFLGDFTKVFIGLRQDLEINITDAYKWKEHQASFKFTLRMDANVEQPKHIVRLMGITTA